MHSSWSLFCYGLANKSIFLVKETRIAVNTTVGRDASLLWNPGLRVSILNYKFTAFDHSSPNHRHACSLENLALPRIWTYVRVNTFREPPNIVLTQLDKSYRGTSPSPSRAITAAKARLALSDRPTQSGNKSPIGYLSAFHYHVIHCLKLLDARPVFSTEPRVNNYLWAEYKPEANMISHIIWLTYSAGFDHTGTNRSGFLHIRISKR